MANNRIYQFGETGIIGQDILTDDEYLADPERKKGHSKGIARARLANKALHQAAFIAHCFAQFIYEQNHKEHDITDSITLQEMVGYIKHSVSNSSIEAGVHAFFAQPSAPLTWVQSTSVLYDDRMLIVVNHDWMSSVLSGHDSPIKCNTIPAHQHKFTTGIQQNNHRHTLPTAQYITFREPVNVIEANQYARGDTTYGFYYNYTDHSHSGVTQQPMLGSGAPQADNVAWEPKYIDVIMCVKTAGRQDG